MNNLPADATDAELVEAIRVSDAAAFKVLYARYYDALFRFIRHRIPVDDIAYELVQDVFVGLWNHRTSLDSTRSIKAYVYRTAHNLIVNYLQKETLESTYRREISSTHLLTCPDESFDLQEHVQAAIEALPEPLRLVFILHRFEGCRYHDIADILDISVKTVESRMTKALTILHERLKPLLGTVLVFFMSR